MKTLNASKTTGIVGFLVFSWWQQISLPELPKRLLLLWC
jgi:hypothetical protein